MADSESQRTGAIESARQRRADSASSQSVRTEWFIDQVCHEIRMPLSRRIRLATEYLKNKVIVNISRPVTKTVVGRRTRVTNRSLPGEFPKADTTQLMKTIFSDYATEADGVFTGYVGTPLDYGVILELRMQRSFLVRSLNEEHANIVKILTGPIT